MNIATDTAEAAPAEPCRAEQLISHYGESHQNPRNEVVHFIAIPLIMLSLIGMLFALHPFLAYAFVATSMVYYARLSGVFLVSMVLWSALTVAIVFAMGPRVLVISVLIFVRAWILQFIGHKIEGKKPSFLKIFSTCGWGHCLY